MRWPYYPVSDPYSLASLTLLPPKHKQSAVGLTYYTPTLYSNTPHRPRSNRRQDEHAGTATNRGRHRLPIFPYLRPNHTPRSLCTRSNLNGILRPFLRRFPCACNDLEELEWKQIPSRCSTWPTSLVNLDADLVAESSGVTLPAAFAWYPPPCRWKPPATSPSQSSSVC